MSTNNEQAKVDFMGACGKDFTKDTCERMWNDAVAGTKDGFPVYHAKPIHDASYAELAKELEMVKTERDRYKNLVRQAADIAQRANDREKAREEAEKERIIISIMNDSHYTKEALTPKPLEELRVIRTAIDNTIEKTFQTVATQIDEANRPKRPNLTVGEWDPVTKTWKGGT